MVKNTQRVFTRLWTVFAVAWTLILGYQFYTARAAYNLAHDEAQTVRVGGNILEAMGHTPAVEDANFGNGPLERLERIERTTKAAKDRAILMLLGGLVVGTMLIGAAYWIVRGGAERDPSA